MNYNYSMIYEYVCVWRDVEMQLYHEISTTGRGLHTRIKYFLGELGQIRWRQDRIYSLFWRPEQLSSDMTLATVPWRLQECTVLPYPGNSTNTINQNTKSAVHNCHALMPFWARHTTLAWVAGRTCQRARAWETRLTAWTQNAKRTPFLLVLLCVLWSSLREINVDLYLSLCIF